MLGPLGLSGSHFPCDLLIEPFASKSEVVLQNTDIIR